MSFRIEYDPEKIDLSGLGPINEASRRTAPEPVKYDFDPDAIDISGLDKQIGTGSIGTGFDEDAFQKWYGDKRKTNIKMPVDPDSVRYNYRDAFTAGAEPDKAGEWPAEFNPEPRFFERIDIDTGMPAILDRETMEEIALSNVAITSVNPVRVPYPSLQSLYQVEFKTDFGESDAAFTKDAFVFSGEGKLGESGIFDGDEGKRHLRDIRDTVRFMNMLPIGPESADLVYNNLDLFRENAELAAKRLETTLGTPFVERIRRDYQVGNDTRDLGYYYHYLTNNIGDRNYVLQKIQEIESRMPTIEEEPLYATPFGSGLSDAIKSIPIMLAGTRSGLKAATVAGAATIATALIPGGQPVAVGVGIPVTGYAFTAGTIVETQKIMQGLAFKDLMQPDEDTGATLDPNLALAASQAIGTAQAMLESVEIGLVLKSFGGAKKVLGKAVNEGIRNAMMDGTVREITQNAMIQYGGNITKEVAVEVSQDIVQEIGRYIAIEAHNDTHADSIPQKTIDDVISGAVETAKRTIPAAMIMLGPGHITSVTAEIATSRPPRRIIPEKVPGHVPIEIKENGKVVGHQQVPVERMAPRLREVMEAKTDEELLEKIDELGDEDFDFMFAGRKAKNYKNAPSKFSSLTDKQTRFEIDDSNAELNAIEEDATLGELLKHDELYDAYPEIKEMPVEFTENLEEGAEAAFIVSETGTPTILLSESARGKTGKKARQTVLHEVQHWIQDKEGFAQGTSPETVRESRRARIDELNYFEEILLTGPRNERFARDFKDTFGREWTLQGLVPFSDFQVKVVASQLGIDPVKLGEFMSANKNALEMAKELNNIASDRERIGRYDKSPFDIYLAYAGEVEARDVGARVDMSPLERSQVQPYMSQNIPLSEMVVDTTGEGKSFSLMPPRGGDINLDNVRSALPNANVTEIRGGYRVALPNGMELVIRKDATIEASASQVLLDYGDMLPPRLRSKLKRAAENDLPVPQELQAYGAWTRLDLGGIIKLAADATTETIRHEVFHAAEDLVLTAKEVEILSVNYGDREQRAQAFAQNNWINEDTAVIFDKIRQFFRDLLERVFKSDMYRAKQLMGKVQSGDIWQREITIPYGVLQEEAAGLLSESAFSFGISPDEKPVFPAGKELVGGLYGALVSRSLTDLPQYMLDNPSWTYEEVEVALEKARKGSSLSDRQFEITRAAIADQGVQFYDAVITSREGFVRPIDFFGEGELEAEISAGIEAAVKTLRLEVSPKPRTARQKAADARQAELRGLQKEKARLQEILEDMVFTQENLEHNFLKQRQLVAEGKKESSQQIKSLEQKIRGHESRIVKLREKLREASKGFKRVKYQSEVEAILAWLKRHNKSMYEYLVQTTDLKDAKVWQGIDKGWTYYPKAMTEAAFKKAANGETLNDQDLQIIYDMSVALDSKKKQRANAARRNIEDAISVSLNDTLVDHKQALEEMLKKSVKDLRAAQREGRGEGVRAEALRIKAIIERQKEAKRHREAVRRVRNRIIKLIQKSKAKKTKSGVLKGRFTPEIQDVLDRMRGVIKQKKDKLRTRQLENTQQIGELNEGRGVTEDMDIAREIDNLALENRIISLLTSMDNMGVDEIQTLHNDIKAMVDEGRLINELKAFNNKYRWDNEREDSKDVLMGGRTLADTTKSVKQQMRELRPKKWVDRAAAAIDGALPRLAWDDLIDSLSRLDKKTGEFQSRLSKIADVHPQENAEKAGISFYRKTVQDGLLKAFGLPDTTKGLKALVKKMNKDVKPDVIQVKNRGETLMFSRSEARKRYMEMKDPTLRPRFDAMGYDFNAVLKQLQEQLTLEDLNAIDFQMDFYRSYHPTINDIYSNMTGVNLSFNPFYSPIRVEDATKADISETTPWDFSREQIYRSSVNPSGVKDRTATRTKLAQQGDLNVLTRHIVEMEHYKAWAPKIRDLRAVFNDRQVALAIKLYHGPDKLDSINKSIDDYARGAKNRAEMYTLMDKIRGRFVRSTLTIKPNITLKQLTSFVAFADQMPSTTFFGGIAKLFSNPVTAIPKLIKQHKFFMENSVWYRERGAHMDRDLKAAQQTSEYKNFVLSPSFLGFLRFNIVLGDMGAIVMGGFPFYEYHYQQAKKRGLPDSEAKVYAIDKFERFANNTQQSADLSKLPEIMRSNNPFVKMWTSYMTTPMQYLSRERSAIRNWRAGRISTKQAAKTFAIYHFILPMFFQWVSSGFEWEDDEMLRAAILGNINGALILGDIIEAGVRAALGQDIYDTGPAMISGFTQDLVNALKVINWDSLTTEQVYKAMRGAGGLAGGVTGLPGRQAVDMGKAFDEIINGNDEQGAWRLLGYGPSVVRKK